MFHSVKLIADIVIFCENKVLLVRYKDMNKYDHESGWFLPDDMLKNREHPDDSVLRILKEQLKIKIDSALLDHIESFTGNDKLWHMVFHYRTVLDSLPLISPSEDIEEICWFDLDNLPPKLDVAHHGWALFTIEEMVNK